MLFSMHMTNAAEIIVCLWFKTYVITSLRQLGYTFSNGTNMPMKQDQHVTVFIRECLFRTLLLQNMLLCRLVCDPVVCHKNLLLAITVPFCSILSLLNYTADNRDSNQLTSLGQGDIYQSFAPFCLPFFLTKRQRSILHVFSGAHIQLTFILGPTHRH